MLIKEAAGNLDRRTVIVASGDLSHKLQEYGPYGYVPEGPEYDERIMDVMGRGAFDELFDFDEGFCDRAAECGHRSFVIMAGAFDGQKVKAERLSHQDVTGVGYGICTFYPEGASDDRRYLEARLSKMEAELTARREQSDEYVKLAYAAVDAWVSKRDTILVPEGLPDEMLTRRAGTFVSIHKHGALRGCIGTIGPTQNSIAEEIIENAKSASTRIDSEDKLDVKRYGVIVRSGRKRGLLLPDLDGVDTPAQQIDIARQKAGIHKYEKISLQRFEVIRHY